MNRPHVVILGAGASRSCCEIGDRHGRPLPLMDDLIETLELQQLIDEAGLDLTEQNFELVYSQLAKVDDFEAVCERIENQLFEYFAALELPEHPTVYDHLVLGLRPKDFIATFNWDPLLMQALRRADGFPRPSVVFLHGNTAIGYCMEHRPSQVGPRGGRCSQCSRPLRHSQLLYPISEKSYSEHPLISLSWSMLRDALESAYILTIFGYGAPSSDVEAIALMQDGWGDPSTRNLEEIEIIDLKDSDTLAETWAPFIHSHHYRTCTSFYDSLIARHPRRTCNAVWSGMMNLDWPRENPVPANAAWSELREWVIALANDDPDEASPPDS
ncbi:MAG: hypothetical protein HKN37_14085 [Rhodothermales bacterium]|nr:hypothetical protein [Rhodothermales bacterium]